MTIRYEMLTDFAEQLVISGNDRIPYRFDGRSIKSLRRGGLLVYPDSTFSLSVGAMLRAIKTWELVAKDTTVSDDRRAVLLGWSKAGQEFVAQHETIGPKKIGGLHASRYSALWSLVVSWSHQEVFHAPDMTQRDIAVWGALEKLGLVTQERRGQTVFVEPTPAGDKLVAATGNPHFA
jgi:hypothetical protein